MWLWETSVVLLQRAGVDVLLVRQAYGHGFWGLPGGMVEPGEDPAAAAVRELWEETGLQAGGVTFVRSYDLVYPGTDSSYGAHLFRCDDYRGEPATQVPGEICAVGWWPLTGLPHPLTPSADAALADLTRCRATAADPAEAARTAGSTSA